MSSAEPRLGVVMVVGECRDRGQHALERLCAQSAIDAMRIVVVDVAPQGVRPLSAPDKAPVEIVRLPGVPEWAPARRAGVERLTTPVVAFVEEHCFTDPGWAEALIEAHEGPWATVGYSFRNANPDSYVSRSAMLTDYGLWLEPATRGPAQNLPGNNVSYKRDAFLALGDRLEAAFGSDFVAHEAFRERGLPMFLETRARAAHLNFTTVWETGLTNYIWCRAMAARRANAAGWSPLRRTLQGLAPGRAAEPERAAEALRPQPSERGLRA